MKKGDVVTLIIDGVKFNVEGIVVNDLGTHCFVSWPDIDFSLHSKKSLFLVHSSTQKEG